MDRGGGERRGDEAAGSRLAFHVVYTALALNFLLPAAYYAIDPAGALRQFVQVGTWLGATGYPHTEDSVLWRVLAIANVATLGFCCVLLQLDLRRWYPVLVPLLFLKGAAALGFAVAYCLEPFPGYLAAAGLDAVTVLAMWYFASRAHQALPAATP